jgi:hypothetical protein
MLRMNAVVQCLYSYACHKVLQLFLPDVASHAHFILLSGCVQSCALFFRILIFIAVNVNSVFRPTEALQIFILNIAHHSGLY